MRFLREFQHAVIVAPGADEYARQTCLILGVPAAGEGLPRDPGIRVPYAA